MKSLIILLAVTAGLASAQQYIFMDLSVTPSASASGSLTAISSGVQAGSAAIPSAPSSPNGHAYMWTGKSASATDIHPGGWYSSQAWAAASGQLAGFGAPVPAADISGGRHALLWSTSGGYVDLTPSSFGNAEAMCTTGAVQGGSGYARKSGKNGGKTVPVEHALLWYGTAASFVDMHPASMQGSRIWGCSGMQQVGDGAPAVTNVLGATHALLWFGRPSSVVDLHPLAGFMDSKAYGVAGDEQVGHGMTAAPNTRHALLWRGSAASVVDLHPAGYRMSIANATNGAQEVGYAVDAAGVSHAIVWSGTAASMIDLNAYMPRGYVSASARSIDANGNIVGSAATPIPGSTLTTSHPVIWVKIQ